MNDILSDKRDLGKQHLLTFSDKILDENTLNLRDGFRNSDSANINISGSGIVNAKLLNTNFDSKKELMTYIEKWVLYKLCEMSFDQKESLLVVERLGKTCKIEQISREQLLQSAVEELLKSSKTERKSIFHGILRKTPKASVCKSHDLRRPAPNNNKILFRSSGPESDNYHAEVYSRTKSYDESSVRRGKYIFFRQMQIGIIGDKVNIINI